MSRAHALGRRGNEEGKAVGLGDKKVISNLLTLNHTLLSSTHSENDEAKKEVTRVTFKMIHADLNGIGNSKWVWLWLCAYRVGIIA